MNIILLSGGSGRRLWPLSNDYCSKQYIKLMHEDDTISKNSKLYDNNKCSMLQRVYGQLDAAGLGNSTVIVASENQVEIINKQLERRGIPDVAKEPERRDTFPAIVLGCAYLYSNIDKSENDYVVVMPVDPYTDLRFFEIFHQLEREMSRSGKDIGLIGAVPTYPSEKYGYIIPEDSKENCDYYDVKTFKEKPSKHEAKKMIEEGALWNCGVFCFRLGLLIQFIKKYDMDLDYNLIQKNYDRLPKISFDYEVLEEYSSSSIVIKYGYLWKDIGTWNTLTEEMLESSIGKVLWDSTSINSHAINMLDIPMLVMGAKNMVVVASHDGILVADKDCSSYIKDFLDETSLNPRYEERRWGVIKTIDLIEDNLEQIKTNKIEMKAGMNTSYHCHYEHDEIITVLSGEGLLIVDNILINLAKGVSVKLEREKYHAIKANNELKYLEVLTGKIDTEDIDRLEPIWENIKFVI